MRRPLSHLRAFPAAVVRGGEQFERAAAVGLETVAQMAKRGESGARVGLRWCHLLWKSVCFSMRPVDAYWWHFSAKSTVISTDGP